MEAASTETIIPGFYEKKRRAASRRSDINKAHLSRLSSHLPGMRQPQRPGKGLERRRGPRARRKGRPKPAFLAHLEARRQRQRHYYGTEPAEAAPRRPACPLRARVHLPCARTLLCVLQGSAPCSDLASNTPAPTSCACALLFGRLFTEVRGLLQPLRLLLCASAPLAGSAAIPQGVPEVGWTPSDVRTPALTCCLVGRSLWLALVSDPGPVPFSP